MSSDVLLFLIILSTAAAAAKVVRIRQIPYNYDPLSLSDVYVPGPFDYAPPPPLPIPANLAEYGGGAPLATEVSSHPKGGVAITIKLHPHQLLKLQNSEQSGSSSGVQAPLSFGAAGESSTSSFSLLDSNIQSQSPWSPSKLREMTEYLEKTEFKAKQQEHYRRLLREQEAALLAKEKEQRRREEILLKTKKEQEELSKTLKEKEERLKQQQLSYMVEQQNEQLKKQEAQLKELVQKQEAKEQLLSEDWSAQAQAQSQDLYNYSTLRDLLKGPQAQTTESPTKEEEDSGLADGFIKMAATVVRTVSDIPGNLDMMFNDMGRAYRKNLMKIKKAMPPKRNKPKRPRPRPHAPPPPPMQNAMGAYGGYSDLTGI